MCFVFLPEKECIFIVKNGSLWAGKGQTFISSCVIKLSVWLSILFVPLVVSVKIAVNDALALASPSEFQ